MGEWDGQRLQRGIHDERIPVALSGVNANLGLLWDVTGKLTIGAAFWFSDEFALSLDIYRTEWGDFQFEDAWGGKSSPISGKEMSRSDIGPSH